MKIIKSNFFKGLKVYFSLNLNKNDFLKVYFSSNLNKDDFLNDVKGQLSLEFLLISFLAILILVLITLPLANLAIDFGLDSSNSLELKSEISKIANAIDSVYSNGAGSKRTINIEVPNDVNVRFSKDPSSEIGLATVDYILTDGSTKKIKVNYKYPYLNFDLHLIKGYNTVVIEWPIHSSEIIIYRSLIS